MKPDVSWSLTPTLLTATKKQWVLSQKSLARLSESFPSSSGSRWNVTPWITTRNAWPTCGSSTLTLSRIWRSSGVILYHNILPHLRVRTSHPDSLKSGLSTPPPSPRFLTWMTWWATHVRSNIDSPACDEHLSTLQHRHLQQPTLPLKHLPSTLTPLLQNRLARYATRSIASIAAPYFSGMMWQGSGSIWSRKKAAPTASASTTTTHSALPSTTARSAMGNIIRPSHRRCSSQCSTFSTFYDGRTQRHQTQRHQNQRHQNINIRSRKSSENCVSSYRHGSSCQWRTWLHGSGCTRHWLFLLLDHWLIIWRRTLLLYLPSLGGQWLAHSIMPHLLPILSRLALQTTLIGTYLDCGNLHRRRNSQPLPGHPLHRSGRPVHCPAPSRSQPTWVRTVQDLGYATLSQQWTLTWEEGKTEGLQPCPPGIPDSRTCGDSSRTSTHTGPLLSPCPWSF